MSSYDKCTCDEEEIENHTCPYAEDIKNECYLPVGERTLCKCCAYCEHQCLMDI